jgi:lipoprotein-releasing system permease protein
MYIFLICWRYLRTRYIALASVISVMLGVATMIVVNSVMAGFSEKMRDRLHGILSDVVVEGTSFDGFDHSTEVMAKIKSVGGDRVVALTPTVEVPGILSYPYGHENFTRLVQIIGIDPAGRASVGEFGDYLVDDQFPSGKVPPSFEVDPSLRKLGPAGQMLEDMDPKDDQFAAVRQLRDIESPDEGMIPGYAIVTHHPPNANRDIFLAPRGARIKLTFPSVIENISARNDYFTAVGFFKSGMSEYDASFVFVPLARLQYLRGMGNGDGKGKVNTVQIKAKPGTDLDRLATDLSGALYRAWPQRFLVQTWEQKQGPLLAAVALEQAILNILLFFIIAVAGFGILAIFSMIVVEKTRDIGVLKSLGASTAGVRAIFLGYGLSLGLVGSGVGMLGGLLFVFNINTIEKWLSGLLGHKVFDDTIYYFNEIPTRVDTGTVISIVCGALLIAVGSSVWPAQRAATLHPVKALRFE